MVNFYTAEKMIYPLAMNYSNTGKSQGVALYRFANPENVNPTSTQDGFSQNFAHAVYGDGPYSLSCPNRTSDILGQNLDALA